MNVVPRTRWIAWASGGFGVATALTVLAGWWLDIPILRRIIPGQPPMVVLTAVGTLLLGCALLATRPGTSRPIRQAGRWLAAAAAAVGLAGLLRYIPQGQFQLDDWVQRLVFGPLKPDTGMALATAASVLATAVGLLDRKSVV